MVSLRVFSLYCIYYASKTNLSINVKKDENKEHVLIIKIIK